MKKKSRNERMFDFDEPPLNQEVDVIFCSLFNITWCQINIVAKMLLTILCYPHVNSA